MKLSEIKGRKALETLADMIDPMARILADGTVRDAVNAKEPVLSIAKTVLKKWPDEVITILALTDGEDPAHYEVDLLTLPKKLFEVINDKEIQKLFFSLEQTEE